MEWAVETVLAREVWKLASAIEEKVAAIALFNDDLQNREYENVVLQAQRDVYKAKLQKCQDTILKHVMFFMQKIQAKTTSSSLCKNTQYLPTISIIICHIMSRGCKNVKGTLN